MDKVGLMKIEPIDYSNALTFAKSVVPKVSSPVHIEQKKYFIYSTKKKYVFTINTSESDFLEIFIVDGKNHKSTVQIFTRTLSSLVCSCKTFNETKINYCEHVAIFNRLILDVNLQQLNKEEIALFHEYRKKLPTTLQEYNGNKIGIFDPRNNKLQFYGRESKKDKLSVNCSYYKEKNYLEEFEERLNALKDVSSNGLLNAITLFDYQEGIFKKMLAAKRCICAMDVGTGKTLTSIACYMWLVTNINFNFTFFIIAPKSLKTQWKKEIETKTGIKCSLLDKESDIESHKKSGNKVAICTYQFITRYADTFKGSYYDVILMDEMQFVRNKDTKAWKAISKLKSEYCFGLSGTIIENKVDDLYSAMNIIEPGVFGPKWKFDYDYQEILTLNEHQVLYKGLKNEQKLKEFLKPFVFSYEKIGTIPINHQYIDIEFDKESKEIHDEVYEKAKILLSKGMTKPLSPPEKMILQGYLTKARQAANCNSKIEKFIDIINETCIKNNQKVVVFSQWTEMIKELQSHMTVEFTTFTGEQNIKQRDAAVKTFQNDPSCMIFFATDAGGVGLDGLQTVSHTVINYELPWNPAKLTQRNARVDRIPQKNQVVAYYLVTKDSIEEKIRSTLEAKEKIRTDVLSKEDN